MTMNQEPSSSQTDDPNQLRALKLQLRGKYLGKHGIHAIGTRFSENAICVYLRPGSQDQETMLQTLKDEVAPHKLVVVEEEPPQIS